MDINGYNISNMYFNGYPVIAIYLNGFLIQDFNENEEQSSPTQN